ALCMEFVEGETLEQILKTRGPLNAREAALVGEDVCRALAAVHAAGFVHRDVKARNVMRDHTGRVVLMDFGAGSDPEGVPRTGGVDLVGTPLYTAPELLTGSPPSVRSDIYSLGVLLYHLVTSTYPVAGATFDEIHLAHSRGQRRPLRERRPDLPAEFIAVVEQALATQPQGRYSNAASLLAALGQVSGTLPQRATKRRARDWWPALVAVPAMVLVFGFFTTAAYNFTTGRVTPFNRESWTVWVEMGVRSLVTPLLYIGLMLLVAIAMRFVVRVLSLSQAFERLVGRADSSLKKVSARLSLDDPQIFAQAVAALGVVALAAIIWRFSAVLLACASATISDVPAARLLPLQWGANRVDPSLFRAALDALVLGLVAAFLRIKRLQALQAHPSTGATVPVAVLLVVTALLIEVPYRLIWKADAERVDYAGERCYALGAQANDMLIHCPDRNPPRNQVVKLDDRALRRLGTIENIFTASTTSR
ncbi:MAG TPA: serine/threonine-protein kinase, partial [Vicinamibacterales bacterium]|nr:serine/threonine-protein kinase [Vicinamibacterales bacterium]